MKKQVRQDCFCALCRTPRKLRYSRRLQLRQVGQILVLTLGLTAVLAPWLDWKGAMSLPIVWVVFEMVRQSLYRKELTCPSCGFDPTWYKKDVKIARQKVEDFLKQNPESPVMRQIRNGEISKNTANKYSASH